MLPARSTALLFGSFAVLSVASCSFSDQNDQEGPPSPPPTARTTMAATSEPAKPPATPTQTEFSLPANRAILVPPMRGSGNKDIPAFSHRKPEYTIYLKCSGGGKIKIAMSSGTDSEWSCDGIPNRHIVTTDGQRISGKISVRGEADWQVAVIDGPPQ